MLATIFAFRDGREMLEFAQRLEKKGFPSGDC